MHYYGARSCNIEPKLDLGYIYPGSLSNKEGVIFVADQKTNPRNYRYKVVQIFETRILAISREIILHAMFNVKCHPKFHNKSNQTSTGWDTTGTTMPEGATLKRLSTRANNDALLTLAKREKRAADRTARRIAKAAGGFVRKKQTPISSEANAIKKQKERYTRAINDARRSPEDTATNYAKRLASWAQTMANGFEHPNKGRSPSAVSEASRLASRDRNQAAGKIYNKPGPKINRS